MTIFRKICHQLGKTDVSYVVVWLRRLEKKDVDSDLITRTSKNRPIDPQLNF